MFSARRLVISMYSTLSLSCDVRNIQHIRNTSVVVVVFVVVVVVIVAAVIISISISIIIIIIIILQWGGDGLAQW